MALQSRGHSSPRLNCTGSSGERQTPFGDLVGTLVYHGARFWTRFFYFSNFVGAHFSGSRSFSGASEVMGICFSSNCSEKPPESCLGMVWKPSYEHFLVGGGYPQFLEPPRGVPIKFFSPPHIQIWVMNQPSRWSQPSRPGQ